MTRAADVAPPSNDQYFVVAASQSENAEVALGLLAVEKGTSPKVVMFGERMIADNGKSALTLRNLATSKGYAVPAENSLADSTRLANLIQLNGKAFDIAYIDEEVASRAAAVQMLSKEAAIASDSDLQIFANATLADAQTHLATARQIAHGLNH
jgi:putative membrane protein